MEDIYVIMGIMSIVMRTSFDPKRLKKKGVLSKNYLFIDQRADQKTSFSIEEKMCFDTNNNKNKEKS